MIKKNNSTTNKEIFKFSYLQTIIHVGAIVISLGSFYIFAFVYNTVCGTCMKLPNTANTIHNSMSNPIYYFIILLTPVMALLPRYFVRVLKNTLRPSDDIIVQLETQKDNKRGEKLLASWSARSTSSRSPIFRWIFDWENFFLFHFKSLFDTLFIVCTQYNYFLLNYNLPDILFII